MPATRATLPATLHVIATPIGNGRDITLRALDVLRRVPLIACEDTRVTGRLLAMHDLKGRLTPFHEHNAERATKQLLARLGEGQDVALLSDAGTALLSDPGHGLVRAARRAGATVTVLPGASAVTAAAALSGLTRRGFVFAGFPPRRQAKRRRWCERLRATGMAVIFFESPHRLQAMVACAAEIFGARDSVLLREMTKRHEEIIDGTLPQLAQYLAENPPRGECTVVIAEADKEATKEATKEAK